MISVEPLPATIQCLRQSLSGASNDFQQCTQAGKQRWCSGSLWACLRIQRYSRRLDGCRWVYLTFRVDDTGWLRLPFEAVQANLNLEVSVSKPKLWSSKPLRVCERPGRYRKARDHLIIQDIRHLRITSSQTMGV